MTDILSELTQRLPNKTYHKITAKGLGEAVTSDNNKITAQYLYPRLEQFFKPNDIIIAETGTSSMGLGFALLPEGAQFHNQTLWGSIGWATPAALGAALAAPEKRIILITGEGSHQ
ncbi:thiamine pyrophosphate enzyme, C-terminal TPP binding domain protein, partial [Vibrio cholerae HC-17A1]